MLTGFGGLTGKKARNKLRTLPCLNSTKERKGKRWSVERGGRWLGSKGMVWWRHHWGGAPYKQGRVVGKDSGRIYLPKEQNIEWLVHSGATRWSREWKGRISIEGQALYFLSRTIFLIFIIGKWDFPFLVTGRWVIRSDVPCDGISCSDFATCCPLTMLWSLSSFVLLIAVAVHEKNSTFFLSFVKWKLEQLGLEFLTWSSRIDIVLSNFNCLSIKSLCLWMVFSPVLACCYY